MGMFKIFRRNRDHRRSSEPIKPSQPLEGQLRVVKGGIECAGDSFPNGSEEELEEEMNRSVLSSEFKREGSFSKLVATANSVRHVETLRSPALVDLADEQLIPDQIEAAKFRKRHICESASFGKIQETASAGMKTVDPIDLIRHNLPPDPLLSTPFGTRRMTYADYTASGRSLKFIEEYMHRVIAPMYANTHTETSASGLQTTHAREEARMIIMKSLHASPEHCDLIFTGSGVTGAIWKLIALLGIHCPVQLLPYLDMKKVKKPLLLISHSEHHSNELMWRETIADVIPIPPDSTGALDLDFMRRILEENKDKYKTVIGSFTAGSNVTGLMTPPGSVASLLHEYGGYACFDYAGAGPYVEMSMEPSIPGDNKSYLDAIYISPHKFVGGPGTPGLLCVRLEFANCRDGLKGPPTIAGGGTVSMVWPSDVCHVADSNRRYESILHVREEAGTPGVMEAIRCGLVFHVRDLVGPKRIEEIEGQYASRAVERLQAKKVWVMGDRFSSITSVHRLSITSFNIWCSNPGVKNTLNISDVPSTTLVHPQTGRPLMLHFHFVAALLNDVYGIQARSGCACAGPLAFRLFGDRFPFMTKKAIDQLVELADDDYHALKPGWCRVNYNYFIPESEFEYITSAIEQIAEHGWKLLPLYALCLKTGQYWYNGVHEDATGHIISFNRFDAVRRITELEFQSNGDVTWNECPTGMRTSRMEYLQDALKIYDNAPDLVRSMLFRFRDLRRKDMQFPAHLEEYRFFALGSEVLPYLGIGDADISRELSSAMAKNANINPMVVAFPKHGTANPMFTMNRPRG